VVTPLYVRLYSVAYGTPNKNTCTIRSKRRKHFGTAAPFKKAELTPRALSDALKSTDYSCKRVSFYLIIFPKSSTRMCRKNAAWGPDYLEHTPGRMRGHPKLS